MVAGAEAVARSLRSGGHEVIVLRDGSPVEVVAEVCLQEDADAVVAPGAAADAELAAALAARGRDDVLRVDPDPEAAARLAGS